MYSMFKLLSEMFQWNLSLLPAWIWGQSLWGGVILAMLTNVFSALRIFIRVRGVRPVLELKIRNVWHVLITVTAHTTAIHVIYAS